MQAITVEVTEKLAAEPNKPAPAVLVDHGDAVHAARAAKQLEAERLAGMPSRVFMFTPPNRTRDLATGATDDCIRTALLEGFHLESITSIDGGALLVYRRKESTH